jgi:hypothetical protein
VTVESLTSSVIVAAEPEVVWEHFTRADAMVTWMGHHALLDPRPGGEFAIDINESQIRGRYQEVAPPRRPSSVGASRARTSYRRGQARSRYCSPRSTRERAWTSLTADYRKSNGTSTITVGATFSINSRRRSDWSTSAHDRSRATGASETRGRARLRRCHNRGRPTRRACVPPSRSAPRARGRAPGRSPR